MKTAEFDYALPPDLIAQIPVEPRDASRLMVVDREAGEICHRRFHDLPGFLRPNDLLVYNESRVIPARLFARKPGGGKAEILLLRAKTAETWEALVKGRGLHTGACVTLLDGPDGQPTSVRAVVVEEKERGARVMRFDEPALALAERWGAVPLPPYIHTPLANADRYQTVFAQTPGSAAAPTAGLHFTPQLLRCLEDMGAGSAFVTLHIGLDTFQPVVTEQIEEHHIHSEYCSLGTQVAKQVNRARLAGGRVVAVGTTSVRVLETAARLAAGDRVEVVQPFEGATDLFIRPGYHFRAVDALLTNFHLPRSTLLMLVAALTGKELLDRAYAEAIRERYRFFSFGDAMLIL